MYAEFYRWREGVAMIPIMNAVLLRGLTELCPMAGIKKNLISNYS